MRIDDTFHDGELFVQRRAGEAEMAQRNAAVIADTIPKGAIRFIGQQPLVVFGSLDSEGNVWASVLVGEPGFLTASEERAVELNVTQCRSSEDDPFWTNIESTAAVGMLVIELATRRRLRINGQIRLETRLPVQIRWKLLDYSPYDPPIVLNQRRIEMTQRIQEKYKRSISI